MNIFHLIYKDIIFKNSSIFTIYEIVIIRFKSEYIFLENKKFKTFLITPYIKVLNFLKHLFLAFSLLSTFCKLNDLSNFS